MREKTKRRFVNPENHPMYGRHHTEESKKKMSKSKANLTEEKRREMGKLRLGVFFDDDGNEVQITICQYDKQGNQINDFFSVQFASEQTGISRSAIANCLCGLSYTAGGYIWRKNDTPITEEDIRLANISRGKLKNNLINKKEIIYGSKCF